MSLIMSLNRCYISEVLLRTLSIQLMWVNTVINAAKMDVAIILPIKIRTLKLQIKIVLAFLPSWTSCLVNLITS